MNPLLLSLLIAQTLSSSVTISPFNYTVETASLYGKQLVNYNLTSNYPVSVMIMNSRQYNQFTHQGVFGYDENCSRLNATSADVSCVYYSHANNLIYFVIMNTFNESTSVSYTLEYTSGFYFEPIGVLVGSILLAMVAITISQLFVNKSKLERQCDEAPMDYYPY